MIEVLSSALMQVIVEVLISAEVPATSVVQVTKTFPVTAEELCQFQSNFTIFLLNCLGGSLSSQSDSSKVVLVFFIGGCTFAEIAALRFLSQLEDSKCNRINFVSYIISI